MKPRAPSCHCVAAIGLMWSLLLLALAAAPPADARQRERAAPQDGRVLRVLDGDSFWFLPAGADANDPKAAIEVRLADIDAPESCQAYGAEAKAALKELVMNKPAQLRGVARDRYGRLVARMTIEGLDVASRMVEEGKAWSARQRNDQGPLLKQERVAKALARGLHATPGAVLPRDFRRNHGPCHPRPSANPALASPAASAPRR